MVWESRFAKEPILPFDIWKAPSFVPMIIATFFTFMAVGISLWYISLWNTEIRGYSILLNGATFWALGLSGPIAAIASGKVIRYIPAEYIMAIGSLASTISLTLVATQPAHQTYWAQTFPSLVIIALGPDFIFTASQIIASNSVKRRHQGFAGTLIGTLASYGLSTGLGFAATVEAYTNDDGRNLVQGYRNALYFGIGVAACAMFIALFFIRIPKDTRDGWDEDDIPETAQLPSKAA